MQKVQNPWSVPVAVEDIPEGGLHLAVEAPAEARAQVLKLAGLRGLPHLSAAFDLMRRGAGVHVLGQVRARVGQTCVVTLESIESDVEEPIDLVFVPERLGAATNSDDTGHKVDGEEPPEPLIGGKLDLGAIATEFLLLGLDPYPRKLGAEFTAVKGDVKADDSARPFAALEALKKRLGG